ncbi:hypothetical protein BX600DRAFT_512797 [Xylariales sp. PMI_506]|nr:hypothetical protein BX600DRAFT_512797 [Xylariales sp. PMI_506]
MSRLMSWDDNGQVALDYLNQLYLHLQHGGSMGRTCRVPFPLEGAPSLSWVKEKHREWRRSLKDSKLAPQRKQFCKDFSKEVIHAYELVSHELPHGTVADLREPLSHLMEALRALRTVKNYDDAHPVRLSELPRDLPGRETKKPEDTWLSIKLAYTHTCLFLMIRILWYVLPDRADIWEEWETSLKKPDWRAQFVLDSYGHHKKKALGHARKKDILDATSQQASSWGSPMAYEVDYLNDGASDTSRQSSTVP